MTELGRKADLENELDFGRQTSIGSCESRPSAPAAALTGATGGALGGGAAMVPLRPGEPPVTSTATTKRQRRMARQPGSDASSTREVEAADIAPPALEDRPEGKKPNKTDIVLALLNREGGVTLDQLVEVTGWLPHSARAALTGLKKKGHPIERTKLNGTSRYTIVSPVS